MTFLKSSINISTPHVSMSHRYPYSIVTSVRNGDLVPILPKALMAQV